MLKEAKLTLPIIKRSQIILKLWQKEDITATYKEFTAEEMKELRDFLEKEILYFSNRGDETPVSLAEIKSHFVPVTNFYYNEGCKEPLEACLNETCLYSNPGCFSRKMKSQIEVLVDLMSPYLTKTETDEPDPGDAENKA